MKWESFECIADTIDETSGVSNNVAYNKVINLYDVLSYYDYKFSDMPDDGILRTGIRTHTEITAIRISYDTFKEIHKRFLQSVKQKQADSFTQTILSHKN